MTATEAPRLHQRTARWPVWLIGVVAVIAVAGVSFVAGRNSAPGSQILHGDAQVGVNMGSVHANGSWYAIGPDVMWVDDESVTHDGTWPSCLRPVGSTARIRFGTSPVRGPAGEELHDVAWIDCRGAKVVG